MADIPTRLIIVDESQGWAGFGSVFCQSVSANHVLARGCRDSKLGRWSSAIEFRGQMWG